MSLRGRLDKLRREAEEGAVVIRLKDGTARYYEEMEVFKQLFLAQTALFKGVTPGYEVLDAVRNATPESRRAFEERFGPITLGARIIGPDWVEAHTLLEDGTVEKVRHEGGSPEAERLGAEAQQNAAGGSFL